ncbi:hypothetical protein NPIL_358821, partial [Nephila pilipes]
AESSLSLIAGYSIVGGPLSSINDHSRDREKKLSIEGAKRKLKGRPGHNLKKVERRCIYRQRSL